MRRSAIEISALTFVVSIGLLSPGCRAVEAEPETAYDDALVPRAEPEPDRDATGREGPGLTLARVEYTSALLDEPAPLRVRLSASGFELDTASWRARIDTRISARLKRKHGVARARLYAEGARQLDGLAALEVILASQELDDSFFEGLAAALKRVQTRYDELESSPPRVVFEIDREVPARAAIRALLTAGEAELYDVELLVEGPEGRARLPMNQVLRGSTHSICQRGGILLTGAGAFVSSETDYDQLRALDRWENIEHQAFIRRVAEGSVCDGRRVLLDPQRECPTVGLIEGVDDLGALSERVSELPSDHQCHQLLVSATDDVSWARLAASLSELQRHDRAFLLTRGLPGGDDCEAGFRPGDPCSGETPLDPAETSQLGRSNKRAPPHPLASRLLRPIVLGALDVEVVSRVVRRQLPALRYCYELSLNKIPGMHGRLVVKFVISGTGAVQTAKAKGLTGTVNEEVASCFVRTIRRLKFPAPLGGGIVIVNFPFEFHPS